MVVIGAPQQPPEERLMTTTSKYCPLTSYPQTGRMTPLPSSPKSPTLKAAKAENTVLSSRASRTSGYEKTG